MSLEYVDDIWLEITDSKGNYEGSLYLKFEAVVEEYANLTQNGKSVASSSTTSGSNTAEKAINNATSDRWESKQGEDPQWIMIDIGDVYTLDSIKIKWHGNAQAKDYRIEYASKLPPDDSGWAIAKSSV